MVAAAVDVRAPLRERLIGLLADGAFHSGQHLARRLDVSRTAVWKALNGLEDLGVELERTPRRGYRWTLGAADGLQPAFELLRARTIESAIDRKHIERLRRLEVLFDTDSTNSRLLAVQDLPAGRSDACLAEHQSAGRGRRGRQWIAPFGGSLCLSVSRLFPETPRQLSALSLAAGVAVLRALQRFDGQGLGLKWPNDLMFQSRKLGGILIELRAEAAGPVYVVIGIGVNLQLTAAARRNIHTSMHEHAMNPAALAEAIRRLPGRNALAAAMIEELLAAFDEFGRTGFRSFVQEWGAADAFAARPVFLLAGADAYKGIARGVDEEGALLLETPGKLLRFTSGEVSLRPGEGA